VTERSKVHRYIEIAHWVAYAYLVGMSENGDSHASPWTDWIELKVDELGQILLPVLILNDSNHVTETRRVVYHRKSMDTVPASSRPEPTAPDALLEEWKAEIITANGTVFWGEP
jgi:hypothetical protein